MQLYTLSERKKLERKVRLLTSTVRDLQRKLDLSSANRELLENQVETLNDTIKAMQLDLDVQHGRVLRFRDEFEDRTAWALSLNNEVKQLRSQLDQANDQLVRLKTGHIERLNQALSRLYHPLLLPIRLFLRSSRLFELEPILIKQNIIRNTLYLKGKYRKANTKVERQLFIQIGDARWQADMRPIQGDDGAYEFSVDAVIGKGVKLLIVYESCKFSQIKRPLDAYLLNITKRLQNRRSTKPATIKLLHKDCNIESDPLILTEPKDPEVSIIIPIYNQIELTMQCLYSIAKNTQDVNYEVIIGDDGSVPTDMERLKKIEHLRIIHNDGTRGFIGNCNSAAKAARGRYLLFLNNDTQVTANWLQPLLSTFKDNPSAGVVGSKLINPDGSLQEAGGILWEDGSGWNYGRNDDPEKPEYNYLRETDYVSGAALMIRAELFNKFGGFDTHYTPAYYEDTDLCFKTRAAGRKVYIQPASVVIHHEGKSNGTSLSSGLKKYQVQNKHKFKERWANELATEHFPNGTNLFHARGRTRYQKVMVVIDHYVPHFDQDAGSRSTWQYICLFIKMGYSVKFIGDNFYPHQPYTEKLQKLGVEVLYGDWYHDNIHNWLAIESDNIDYIFTNRSHITVKYLKTFAKMQGTKVLYYGHDLGSLRNERRYQLTNDISHLKAAEREAELEDTIWKVVDTVYYPSEIETEIVKQRMPEAHALTLPLNIYEPTVSDYGQTIDERKDIIFVGGFGHPPNEEAVLWFLEQCWPKIHAAIPDARFVCIGSKPSMALQQKANQHILVTGWVSDEELEKWYGQARMVAVPLLHGAGIKGKVIEAILHGVPLLMTSIAAEGLPGVDACGTIADTAEDFSQQVINCYQDTHALKNMSEATFNYIESHFSKSKAMHLIKKGFRKKINDSL